MQTEIPLFKVFMSEESISRAQVVLGSGYVGQGPQVDEFERRLSDWVNGQSLVTLNTGTNSLQLALYLANVGDGDEVISTPLTCSATNIPILHTGAQILWADTDPDSCNISIPDIVQKASSRTKAIMVIHWGGTPVDVFALSRQVTDKLGFCPPIIEDCAHAMGAKYPSRGGETIPVGSSGNFCEFSFQAIKHLTTVDGGMLTLPSDSHQRAKLLRWYGIDREEKGKGDFRCETNIPEAGWKYHMNDLSAAIGIGNLGHLPTILTSHRANASFYSENLQDIPGLELFPFVPNSSYWLYTLKVEGRSKFISMLKSKGIISSRVHERNDIHSCFAKFALDLPSLNQINDQIVCIPVGWWVTSEDREYIVDCIKGGW